MGTSLNKILRNQREISLGQSYNCHACRVAKVAPCKGTTVLCVNYKVICDFYLLSAAAMFQYCCCCNVVVGSADFF